MGFDIYGNRLLPGHCEVHPHVHEEYPCSVCLSEAQRSQARAVTRWPDCWRSGPEHYECARAEIERLMAWTDQDEPLPEDDAIKVAFPLNSKRYDLYAEAMRLVSAKRSKGALVDLVNWLLHERDALRADAAIGKVIRRRLVSSNGIPVSRAHVTADEVAAIDAARGGEE
jgi:hypothetical protein